MATAGLKIWGPGPNPKLLVGPDTSIGAIIGAVDTNKVSGSISDVRFALGTPRVFAALPVGTGTIVFTLPKISFSGNTMTWTYDFASASNPNVRIIYGFS